MQLDFTVPDEGSITRTATLQTDKTVFVTVDEGQSTWYAYRYNSTTHLWEATKKYSYDSTTEKWTMTTNTKGITWTSNTMLIYAVVRNDNHPTAAEETAGESPITQPVEIMADQSSIGNLNAGAMYGMAERVEYTTGRIHLRLRYIVSKILVKVSNCNNPSNWTCTTNKEGIVLGRNVACKYYTKGNIKIGDDKVTFTNQTNSVNISLYRQNENASAKTVEFVAYLIPSVGPNYASFLLSNGTVTNQAEVATDGGVTMLGGYITTVNVVITYPE